MDFPMSIGTLCYVHDDAKTLFLQRNQGEGKDIHHGLYVFPGGRFERGERGVDCAIREIKEETGLTVRNLKLRQIIMFHNEGRLLGGRTDRPDFYVELYETTDFEGELKLEKKGDRLLWVDNSEIQTLNMHECDRKSIELLEQEGVYEIKVKYAGDKMSVFDYMRVA